MERAASTEALATGDGFSSIYQEPSLNSAESEFVSGEPKTSSADDPSYGEEIYLWLSFA